MAVGDADHSTVSGNSTAGGLSLGEYGRAGRMVAASTATRDLSNSTVSGNSTSARAADLRLFGDARRQHRPVAIWWRRVWHRAATITGSEINGNNGGGIMAVNLTVMDTSSVATIRDHMEAG